MGPVFVLCGVAMAAAGLALLLDIGGAASWWVAYSTRQRELWGRWIGPSYGNRGARLLGLVVMLFGAMFITAGVAGP